MTESFFHCAYLVSRWVERFGDHPGFLGVLVRASAPGPEEREVRARLHARLAGRIDLDEAEEESLRACLPSLSRSEELMLRTWGPPPLAVDSHPKTWFLGPDLNAPEALEVAREAFGSSRSTPWLFVFLDQLLGPWWLERLPHHILNVHSAVLPYARGMYAIERVAVQGDPAAYRRACGATVHYVDDGVDSGPIVRVARFRDPFRFASIWEAKANIYRLGFELLGNVAEEVVGDEPWEPVGTMAVDRLAHPNYAASSFTKTIRATSEARYAEMRQRAFLAAQGIDSGERV